MDEAAYRASLEDVEAVRGRNPRAPEIRARVQAAWADAVGVPDRARPAFEAAIADLRTFETPGARMSLINAPLSLGLLEVRAGRDPAPRWREAASAADAAIRVNPYEPALWY